MKLPTDGQPPFVSSASTLYVCLCVFSYSLHYISIFSCVFHCHQQYYCMFSVSLLVPAEARKPKQEARNHRHTQDRKIQQDIWAEMTVLHKHKSKSQLKCYKERKLQAYTNKHHQRDTNKETDSHRKYFKICHLKMEEIKLMLKAQHQIPEILAHANTDMVTYLDGNLNSSVWKKTSDLVAASCHEVSVCVCVCGAAETQWGSMCLCACGNLQCFRASCALANRISPGYVDIMADS